MYRQKVVVIQDASEGVCPSALTWALDGLSLRAGDTLTLLAVLHYVDTQGQGCKKLLGYKKKVDSSSPMCMAKQRKVNIAAARKKEEYENNMELLEISNVYQKFKVEFKIEVAAGPSPKTVALRSAENLKSTWIILDRQMKKKKKYFLKRLSCGISRMKSNGSIEQLRGPKTTKSYKLLREERHLRLVTYDEMMPGSPQEEDLFSIELFHSRHDHMSKDTELMQYTIPEADLMKQYRKPEQVTESSTCTICNNRRPNIEIGKDFRYVELAAATDGFSPHNSLSKSDSSRPSFRGQLRSKLKIVVKKQRLVSSQEHMTFKSEVVYRLCRARHKNVIMLLGFCIQRTQGLLVYEYACNGSLKEHLSKHHPLNLTLTQRMKIAVGASRGLNYLHQNHIIHGNLRPSNIFLTHDFEPLVGDFGFLKVKSDHSLQHKNDKASVYFAPECLKTGTLSEKTDVYSFGVVLLELITEWRSIEKNIVKWARKLLRQRRYHDLLDPTIIDEHDRLQLYHIAQLAKKCLKKNPKKRLIMNEVMSTLENITGGKRYIPMESQFECSLLDSNRQLGMGREMEQENQNISTSFSATYCSTNSSVGRSLSPSAKSCYRFAKPKHSTTRIPVYYAEMLN